MSTEELLCHCEVDAAGHVPGEGACPVVIKPGKYGRAPLPGTGGATSYAGATGTCPKCERPGVKVRRAKVVTTDQAGDLSVGVLVALRPALAAHRVPGRGGGQCEGAGELPVETRWRSTQCDAIVRDYGPAAVAVV